jgi:hypothetical protein
MTDSAPPIDDGEDREEYSQSSRYWLAEIEAAQKVFKTYHEKCDNIDKQFADLSRLASTARDREFQLFWANIQVVGPSIYSRAPVPVVTPRFKDQKPVPRLASELLERSTVVVFDMESIDLVMRQVRDDLVISARGAVWLRYDSEDGQKRVCIDHADRKDFLHQPARSWKEVGWVAKRSFLTKEQIKKRFKEDYWQKVTYAERKDNDNPDADDCELKAGVWEIWCKEDNEVVWVAEGCDEVLDSGEPHLELEGFYPCPCPAYSTVQRRTLVPIPDFLFYKDQLEEINDLTARLSALTDALKVRGFYPAGAGDIGEAIETAMKNVADNQVLIPIANWGMLGTVGAKDMIVWMPLDMIATTITQLVAIRKQLIDDVYQVTGLSDIMRGSTVASETLGAQQLKSQYGSIRIRDRQDELIRLARDVTRLTAEIMAENFDKETLLEMSQLDIKTDADLKKEVEAVVSQIEAQAQQAMQNPQMMQQAQANPQAAQQMIAQLKSQAQAQIDKINEQPTIEKVMKLIREQRTRPFILDIETDSTIAPDENAQKQRATEYLTAMGTLLAQAVPAVQQLPQIAPLVADTIKFTQSQFRVGRQMDQTVEEFVEKMKALADAPRPPDPAHAQAEAEQQAAQVKAQSEAQKAQADAMRTQADAQAKMTEAQTKAQDAEAERQIKLQQAFDASEMARMEREGKAALVQIDMDNKAQKHAQDMDIGALQLEKLRLEIEGVQIKTAAAVETHVAKVDQINTQTDNAIRSTEASIQAAADSNAIKAASMEPA